MLLTITTTHHPATDLGFLLHKNPGRVHRIELAFGEAIIVYPEATAERCTAALIVDVDPVGRKNRLSCQKQRRKKKWDREGLHSAISLRSGCLDCKVTIRLASPAARLVIGRAHRLPR